MFVQTDTATISSNSIKTLHHRLYIKAVATMTSHIVFEVIS